jgi:hypothetical protein
MNEGSLVTFPVHCFDLSAAKPNILQLNIPSILSFASTKNVISYRLLKQVQLDIFLGIIKKGVGYSI